MTVETARQNTMESLYEAAAKPLYNMAVYTIVDRRLAERTAAVVFLDACRGCSGIPEGGPFMKRCFGLLYRRGRELCQEDSEFSSADTSGAPLGKLLSPLSYDERFILLLFCRHKYSLRQISEITGLPEFTVDRRLTSAAGKTNTETGNKI
jgi:DNA-directed RNA polymerase specialized sigma24 family protein